MQPTLAKSVHQSDPRLIISSSVPPNLIALVFASFLQNLVIDLIFSSLVFELPIIFFRYSSNIGLEFLV